jgi:hypothetical protein
MNDESLRELWDESSWPARLFMVLVFLVVVLPLWLISFAFAAMMALGFVGIAVVCVLVLLDIIFGVKVL